MKSLKTDTVKALSWNTSGNIVGKGLQFIISIILARILSPEEFGLMGIVMIFSMIAQVFTDFGFASAIIQKQNVTKSDLSSVFFLNVIIGFILAFISFSISDYIAVFFEQDILSNLIKIISVTFILSSINIVPQTILRKSLNFKIIVTANIISSIISGTIAIIMALNDYGVYSLLAQSIIQISIQMPFAFIASRWWPQLCLRITSLKKFFTFGFHLFLINVLSKVMQEVDSVLIAKFYPIANLGIYKRAKTLRDFPVNFIFGSVNTVMFPAMSKIQKDNSRLIKYYTSIIHIISFVLIPLCFLLVIIAKPLIILLLTEKWAEVIPYFQILIPVGFMVALGGLNINIISAKGDSKFLLKFEFLKRILYTVIVITSLNWGILSLVIALSVSSVFFFIINLYYGGKYIKLKLKDQLIIIVPYLLLSLGITLISYLMFNLFTSYWLQLIVPSSLALIVYIIVAYLINLKGYKLLFNEILLPMFYNKKPSSN